jgi:hypothetical protein
MSYLDASSGTVCRHPDRLHAGWDVLHMEMKRRYESNDEKFHVGRVGWYGCHGSFRLHSKDNPGCAINSSA